MVMVKAQCFPVNAVVEIRVSGGIFVVIEYLEWVVFCKAAVAVIIALSELFAVEAHRFGKKRNGRRHADGVGECNIWCGVR